MEFIEQWPWKKMQLVEGKEEVEWEEKGG